LLVEGKKMSKSLGNFFTLRDLLAKGFLGREIRCLLLSAHYRETFNFTMDGLQGAKNSIARIDECLAKLRETAANHAANGTADTFNAATLQRFSEALDDDLNVSAAWGAVFEWVREWNRRMAEGAASASDAATALTTWDKMDSVLGIGAKSEAEIPAEISALLEARQAARKEKNFKRSDEIRAELQAKGWAIEDTPKGPKLKKV
jgi:cysteinyl-tRNA synthetase